VPRVVRRLVGTAAGPAEAARWCIRLGDRITGVVTGEPYSPGSSCGAAVLVDGYLIGLVDQYEVVRPAAIPGRIMDRVVELHRRSAVDEGHPAQYVVVWIAQDRIPPLKHVAVVDRFSSPLSSGEPRCALFSRT
jgi:hypothetical protein